MAILKTEPTTTRAEQSDDQGSALEHSVASIQRQCNAILEQVTAMREQLSQLARREAELRAVLERETELDAQLDRLGKVLRKTTTGEKVTAAIESATLHLEPFPYAVIDDLLPASLYDSLLTGLPPVELFENKPAGKEHLDLPFPLAPLYSRRIWRYMASEIVPKVITPALISKFRTQIDEWIVKNWPDIEPRSVELHGSGGRIMFRRRGYCIRPHRDPKWSFITCILYLARPGDSETWGTQIYAVDQDQEAKNAAPYWIDEQYCRLVEDVGFRPNRLLVFLNSVGAHGAHIPADAEPEDLQRFIYQFRVGPPVDAVTRLRALLPEERQPLWAGKTLIDY
jgi:DNA-binding FrmR family transcriptional regulator